MGLLKCYPSKRDKIYLSQLPATNNFNVFKLKLQTLRNVANLYILSRVYIQEQELNLIITLRVPVIADNNMHSLSEHNTRNDV